MPPNHDDLQRIEGKLDEALRCLQGDLPNGRPGLVGRVDRLEVADKRREWWSKAAIGAGMTALIGTAWQFITGGKHP